MAHLKPDGTDLVCAAFIVHPKESKVLLVHHKTLDLWLGPGGHIELDTVDASPDAALIREVLEETGLRVRRDDGADPEGTYDAYVAQSPFDMARKIAYRLLDTVQNHYARAHWTPWAVETHDFVPIPGHKHLCLVYLVYALTDEIKLEAEAHHEIRWFSLEELATLGPRLLPTVRRYAECAILARHGPLLR